MRMTEEHTQQEHQDGDRTLYELGYHLIPTIAEDDLAAEVTSLKNVVEQYDGSFVSEDAPKLLQLAYPMEHRTQSDRATYESAYFGWIKFDMTPENVEKMQDDLAENTSILRWIVVKTVPEYEPHRPQAQQEESESESETKTTKTPHEDISDVELDKHINELVGDEKSEKKEDEGGTEEKTQTSSVL